MKKPDLSLEYSRRLKEYLEPMAKSIETFVRDTVKGYPRIDRVRARAKSLDRFLEKSFKQEEGKLKYTDPLSQIQDQIGARIVTFYLGDVEPLSKIIDSYFSSIEEKSIVPDSPSEFGYEGKHFILLIPDDLFSGPLLGDFEPKVFELQIKTVFQYAWGEADHDLAYKSTKPLTPDQRRRVAFTAAQAWGADKIFDELSKELIQFN